GFRGGCMKRSNRLIAITNYFMSNPRQLVQLTYFSDVYSASKSSISEDLDIVDDMFQHEGIGFLDRIAGAARGVMYVPYYSKEKSAAFIQDLCTQLEDPERILPGGYLYMSDILGNPATMRKIGHIFATAFSDLHIDAIVTVATKGISLANAIAFYLNVPVVTVRRDPKVTE